MSRMGHLSSFGKQTANQVSIYSESLCRLYQIFEQFVSARMIVHPVVDWQSVAKL